MQVVWAAERRPGLQAPSFILARAAIAGRNHAASPTANKVVELPIYGEHTRRARLSIHSDRSLSMKLSRKLAVALLTATLLLTLLATRANAADQILVDNLYNTETTNPTA